MYDRAETDLEWWFLKRDALLGISATGFEGGGASIWDDARSARAHGLAIDESSGEYELTRRGRLSLAHRVAVAREAQLAPVIATLPTETYKALQKAFSTCTAPTLVVNYFNTTSRAPLIGLGLQSWYELRHDERRSPSELLRAWDGALKANRGIHVLLRPVRARTLDVYHAALGVYDEVARYIGRERREAREARIQAIRDAERSSQDRSLPIVVDDVDEWVRDGDLKK